MSARKALITLREQAAQMLMHSSSVVGLELHEARRIVAVMKPIFVEAGAVLMREGQTEKADFMLLLLEGQIRAESRDRARGEPDQVISVLDPGALIGEMSLVDDGPRSATCIALTDLTLAGLSRNALRRLIEAHPALGARLLLLLAQSTSLKLRETNRRLRAMTQITRAMQRELDATHAVNRRLLDAG